MQVDGKTNTTTKTTYFGVDLHPFEGSNYYALTQVDINEKTTSLETITLAMRYIDEMGTIHLYNLTGKVMMEENVYRSQIAIMLHGR